MSAAFDFGRNWEAFSAARLDGQRLNSATESLQGLLGARNIAGRTFLDIGCGSGLFSIAAAQCGAARVVGFDISSTAVEVSDKNVVRLAEHLDATVTPDFLVGDVLDRVFLAELGTFDIVYAWGSLHHTGSMWQAMRNASSLVEPEQGILAISIYNRHWTSPIWKQIKRLYNVSPGVMHRLLNYLFAVLIFVAKAIVTSRNPLEKERGMDFWHDVIDWLGGYPYEYARIAEVVTFVQSLGFRIERVLQARVPTGCNELVFRRPDSRAPQRECRRQ
jgi:2-polyprenyl-6-hydroxyphenyl methylase/3-demethylubiquinone-9 3-methyltransferase